MTFSALTTDLYELTMMAGYYTAGVDHRATFELYVRELPPHRGYLVAAGLEQALQYLEALRFSREQIDYLRRLPVFQRVPRRFFDDYLPSFAFTGDVWAVEEGTPVFPHEPLVRVTAPLAEAQLVETALLAIVTFQTSIASKASRVVAVAGGRPVIEFGARRAHGLEAGLLAARAAYLAGCAGTSDVEAGFRFGIPVSGTMAHSWVMAFPSEMDAFRQYAALYGEKTVFLIDTYDTMRAAQRIAHSGLRAGALRIDSGDIVAESRAIRQVLDRAGLQGTDIFISGDLDEHKIRSLLERGARISGVGVGTALSTSSDAPALGGVYKLVEIERDGRAAPVVKHSPGKASYAGVKQVWRTTSAGRAEHDLLAEASEPAPEGSVPLLTCVMKAGRPAGPPPALADLRARCFERVQALPDAVRRLEDAAAFPVEVSARLRELTEQALADARS